MNISLKKVESKERKKLEKLLQLYLHDLSLYFPIPFDSKVCEYEYDLDKYFDKNLHILSNQIMIFWVLY